MELNTSEQAENLENAQAVADFLVNVPLVLLVVALTMGIVLGLDKVYGYFDKRKAVARAARPSQSVILDDEEEE